MLHVELTSFATTIDARIRSVGTGAVTPTGRDVVQTVNGGESRYRGVEAQLRWAPADALRVDTVVSYVRAEDAFAGEVTAGDRVPPLHGRIRFSRSLPAGLDVHLTLAGASRQDRLSARDIRDPRIDPSGTDGWVRADLGALWQVSNGLRVRVDAGNLLDARYREHGSGLDAAGRHLAVAFDWNF
jgi:outer membrane receptor protein involved in Fe transport